MAKLTKKEQAEIKIAGAEQFFGLLDGYFKSFVITEQLGKLLQQYRDLVSKN